MTQVFSGDTGASAVATGSVTSAAIAAGAVDQTKLASGVAGNGPFFSVWANGAQTVTSGASTKVTFNTKEYDTANAFDATTNYRFQPNVAGYYQITVSIRTSSGAVTNSMISLHKNEAEYMRGQELSGATLVQYQNQFYVYLNGSSDYVDARIIYTGTGTLSIGNADFRYTNHFQGHLARSA
jgi:hypothetical protein